MKYLSGILGLALLSGTANAIELVHQRNSINDFVEVTLDCHAYSSGGWIAIYAEDAKLSQYGSSKTDWFYLNQGGDDCLFEFAPRDTEGTYYLRLFETSSYDAADEELAIQISTGPGRVREPAPAVAEIDNDNFWISAPASQLKANESFKVGINCHETGLTYGSRSMVVQLMPAGDNPNGEPSGKFQKEWYWMKNRQAGAPCYYNFAGQTPGDYEIMVFQSDQQEIRVRLPITFASSQAGDPIKKSFDIGIIEQPANKVWDPVRGKNNCIKLVDNNTITNRCRNPVSVTMLQQHNGTGWAPRPAMSIATKEQQTLDFTAELSVGWFACPLDDTECMAVQSCLADLKANWKSHYSTDSETRCNYSGHYMPL